MYRLSTSQRHWDFSQLREKSSRAVLSHTSNVFFLSSKHRDPKPENHSHLWFLKLANTTIPFATQKINPTPLKLCTGFCPRILLQLKTTQLHTPGVRCARTLVQSVPVRFAPLAVSPPLLENRFICSGDTRKRHFHSGGSRALCTPAPS